METNDMPPPVLIVGAGMTGLTAAGALAREGVGVLVIDKGRAPGGRMATRTVGDARFDHGAQHFGARRDDFRRAVDDWLQSGVARPWFEAPNRNADGTANTRYCGAAGMRRIPELLAGGLTVRTGVAVAGLAATSQGVTALTANGPVAEGCAIVLTPPVPQTIELLGAGGIVVPGEIRRSLEQVSYHACLAVMARLGGAAGLSDGHLTLEGEPIAWMADNQHKGTSPTPAITIHSTPSFAARHLEEDYESWVPELVGAAGPLLSSPILEAIGHRWRYAEPRINFDTGFMSFDAGFPIVLAGEVFAGAKVEGAFSSGLAAARRIIEVL
jgi:predicted NAD/FAD-dependent oxidoreductase